MAQDITLMGADYEDVPAVELPKTGGGTATFTDVTDTTAEEADVLEGEVFYTANGVRSVGTLSASSGSIEMTVLSYGSSTWQDFIDAYNSNTIVYCRASSNSNPATGNQTRMAFMAYVNSTPPTNVEFQYYRSVSSHTASQQGDQVYIYKLDKTSGWSVTVREAMSKIAVDSSMNTSYSSGTLTLKVKTPLPAVTAADNGKILKVVNGAWAVVEP
jgi:hypothetical protein